ncbi:MAG: AmmeMemoRadiSam system protein B [Melioribacteraceae bacterium]|nr:AmmeMemoRadiSam system protein B [Melioribacteraceae bacterium]
MKGIREPAVAGMFYPATSPKLKEQINQLLNEAVQLEQYSNVAGIVSPHAGYLYSGKTAAYGFNSLLKRDYETVIIISPSHREYFRGISIYDGEAYRTPLGDVPVNKEMIEKITTDSKIIFKGIQGHRAEHAVEVQIPFLQMILKDFSIVPIVLGDQSRNFVFELADKLALVIDDKTLIIASSDLSHFYSRSMADKLDSVVESDINNNDYEKLQSDLETGRCEACGGGAIVAMMRTANLTNKKNARVLSRTDSGDVTGDHSEVVGYLSAVIYS